MTTEIEMFLETAPDDPGPYRRLDLNLVNGFVPQSLNFGFPEIRENVDKRPANNGTDDYTEFFGASAVQIVIALEASQMQLPASERKLEDTLKRWLNPLRRSHLVYRQRGEIDWRMAYVRGSGGARQLQLARTRWGEVSMTFRVPKGIHQSYELLEMPLPFSATELGRAYNLTYDRVYPAANPVGVVEIDNQGNVEASPIARIYGPCSNFRLENINTGESLKFKSTFALLAGEFLVVDFDEGTVLMGGDLLNSRYNQIDVPNNTWWKLDAEAITLVRPVAATFTAPQAHMELYWRHTYVP